MHFTCTAFLTLSNCFFISKKKSLKKWKIVLPSDRTYFKVSFNETKEGKWPKCHILRFYCVGQIIQYNHGDSTFSFLMTYLKRLSIWKLSWQILKLILWYATENNRLKASRLDAFCHRLYCTVSLNSNEGILKTWHCFQLE